MLKVIGPRVLIKPVETKASTIIETTDREVPTLGLVVGVGSSACGECGGNLLRAFKEGMYVTVPPTAGQHVTVDDADYWIVMASDVIAEWTDQA